VERRATYRRDWAYAVEISKRAVERLQPLAGARGLSADSPIQRLWRDVHAVASHAALGWDIQGQHFSRAALGLPLADPRI
jgi:alkylation response protein AidB-like acyl-CoA dehydrogenase